MRADTQVALRPVSRHNQSYCPCDACVRQVLEPRLDIFSSRPAIRLNDVLSALACEGFGIQRGTDDPYSISAAPRSSGWLLAALVVASRRPSQRPRVQSQRHGHHQRSAGRVLPGVSVTVVNVDTSVPIETVTDRAASISVKNLNPGRYKITAALQGFKTFVAEGIVLHTAETATSTSSWRSAPSRDVTSSAAHEVETNHPCSRRRWTTRKCPSWPLNGRQVYMLLSSRGHAVHPADVRRHRVLGHAGLGRQRQRSIHGRRTGNKSSDDGASNAGPAVDVRPPVDAIEEFKSTGEHQRAVRADERRRREPDVESPWTNQFAARGRRWTRTALDSNRFRTS